MCLTSMFHHFFLVLSLLPVKTRQSHVLEVHLLMHFIGLWKYEYGDVRKKNVAKYVNLLL